MENQEEIKKPSLKIPIIAGILGLIAFILIVFVPKKNKQLNPSDSAILDLTEKLELKNAKIKKLKSSQTDEKIELEKELLSIKKELKDERKKGKTPRNIKSNKIEDESIDDNE